MDDALSHWLGLREPADTAGRSEALTQTIVDALGVHERLQVLDLGTGTGSNVRYLAPRLQRRQHWLIVDRNVALLELAPRRMATWGAAHGHETRTDGPRVVIRGERLECHVETRYLDLGALDDADIFAGRHLVTASALLDLASGQWLATLARRCRAADAAALFAITYNGRSSCTPREPEDAMVRDLLNLHQKRDKGLGGPAEGPDAAECVARSFAELGYHVRSAPSDWVLGSDEGELQQRLIEGWADAAAEMRPDESETIARWLERRAAHVEAGRSRIIVGHLDVAAWLPLENGLVG